jgi:hypothetical protein
LAGPSAANTVYGASAAVVTSTSQLFLPGLSQTITVPANTMVYISTDGGGQTNSVATTAFSIVDVAVVVDNLLLPNGFFRRIFCSNPTFNTTGVVIPACNWSLGGAVALSPGTHTIAVVGSLVSTSNAPAVVSGDANSVYQGTLTVMFLKP